MIAMMQRIREFIGQFAFSICGPFFGRTRLALRDVKAAESLSSPTQSAAFIPFQDCELSREIGDYQGELFPQK